MNWLASCLLLVMNFLYSKILDTNLSFSHLNLRCVLFSEDLYFKLPILLFHLILDLKNIPRSFDKYVLPAQILNFSLVGAESRKS